MPATLMSLPNRMQAHDYAPNLPEVLRHGDILIVAVGSPELVKGSWVKPGAVVIDVGINVVEVSLLWMHVPSVMPHHPLLMARQCAIIEMMTASWHIIRANEVQPLVIPAGSTHVCCRSPPSMSMTLRLAATTSRRPRPQTADMTAIADPATGWWETWTMMRSRRSPQPSRLCRAASAP